MLLAKTVMLISPFTFTLCRGQKYLGLRRNLYLIDSKSSEITFGLYRPLNSRFTIRGASQQSRRGHTPRYYRAKTVNGSNNAKSRRP